jgi:hypothetical protein
MLPAGGAGAESSSAGTITMSAPLAPASAGGSNITWEAVASVTVCPSLMTVMATNGGATVGSSTTVAMASPSLTCIESRSAYGGC